MVMKQLRNKKNAKKIWIVLAVLILPAFVLWGSGSMMRSQKEAKYAGKIFGKKITTQEYREAYMAVRNQAILLLGEDFNKMEKNLNLQDEAWSRLILLHEANNKHIKVSDREVIETIQKYPFFQKNGKFNTKAYEDILTYAFRIQPRAFEEQLRGSLTIKKLYERVSPTTKLSDEAIKDAYKNENEQLSIYYLAAKAQDFMASVITDEKEVKGYYEKNQLLFKSPLSFNLESLEIKIPENASEGDLKKMQEKAQSIYLRAKKEKDFSPIAKELSLPAKETGFFTMEDPIPGIGWSAEILQVISGLKEDEFLPPIFTQKGAYILRLKQKMPAHLQTFEEAKDKAQELLIKAKAKEVAKEKITAASNAKATDFTRLAKEFNLKSGSTDLFKRRSYIEDMGGSDEFFEAAIKLKDGQESTVIETPQGFYIVKLKQLVPIDENKFKAEQGEFKEKTLLKIKEESFVKLLNELRKKANLSQP